MIIPLKIAELSGKVMINYQTKITKHNPDFRDEHCYLFEIYYLEICYLYFLIPTLIYPV